MPIHITCTVKAWTIMTANLKIVLSHLLVHSSMCFTVVLFPQTHAYILQYNHVKNR